MRIEKPSKEQKEIFETILTDTCNILVDAKAGTGKCLGKDTKIIMYDGSIKKVQDIVEGDLLMGDDSSPRTVLSTTKGNGKLYEVKPNREKSFICNDVHVLTMDFMYRTNVHYKVDVALNLLLSTTQYNYRNKNNTFIHYSLYKESVDFTNSNKFDYYSIGNNFFNQEFNRKHILTTVKNRYELLSGIVDRYCTIQYNELKIKNSTLIVNYDLFKELLDSLGCIITYYNKGVESYIVKGDFKNLNLRDKKKKEELNLEVKRNYSTYKFSVDYVGIGDYYGFTLDGNGRFLLDNYIVTHNTTTITNAIDLILENEPDKKIGLVAFNKHISEELKNKIPATDNIRISTTHGVGYGAIRRRFGKNDIKVDSNKIYKIINKKAPSWNINPARYDVGQYKDNIKNIVSLCKLTLSQSSKQIEFISNKYGYPSTPDIIRNVRQVLEESVKDTKTFDYDDMVFLPAVDKKYFIFQSDYVFVDECIHGSQKIVTEKGNFTVRELYQKKLKRKYVKLPKALSYNPKTKEFEYKDIEKIWKSKERKDIVSLKTINGVYKTSDIHKYLTLDGYKEAKSLTEKDFLVTYYEDYNTGYYLPNEDQRKFLQAFLMTRFRKDHKVIKKTITFENKLSKQTLENSSYYNIFKPYVYATLSGNMRRVFSPNIYFEDYNYNELDFIENMDVKDLAILYMEGNISNKTKNSFVIKAKNYDFLLVYKKLIEDKFNLKELKVKRLKSQKYTLVVDDSDKEYFWDLIKGYLLDEFTEGEDIQVKYDWKVREDMIPITFIKDVNRAEAQEYTYDMTIKDNHNFLLTTNSLFKKTKGVVVHNCQDYNKAQQYILNKMLKKDTGRLISFGDKNQAIYSFMGADINAFNWFKDKENTKTLPLSVSYRCSKKVIKLAQSIVPDIQAKEGADEGNIRYGSVISDADVGDFVLARKNAPFIKLVFDLIDVNKIATIRGKDIGENLKEKIRNYKTFEEIVRMINETISNTINGLVSLGISEPQNHPTYITVNDNMNIIRNLMLRTKNVYDLMLKIDQIFTDTPEGIILSTIHKSKGLEADRVFIIKPEELKIKSKLAWMWQGELNLEYIAYTRAKNEIIIDKDWTDERQ